MTYRMTDCHASPKLKNALPIRVLIDFQLRLIRENYLSISFKFNSNVVISTELSLEHVYRLKN